MKIVRLQSQNVMKLVAVDITPDGNLVIVGGKNGAGKSSVLNSIAMALGGKAMCPQEPIRAGEAEAKIEVDLGDLRVTRKFKREKIETHGNEGEPPHGMAWGETTTSLIVTNKDGAHYPSPQAVLDKLLGKLTFDPLAFKDQDPKVQDATLRKLVGLDVTEVEARRRAAYDERTMLNKTRGIKAAQAAALPVHVGVPEAEASLDGVSQEMLKAEEYRKLAEDAERAASAANELVTRYLGSCARIDEKIFEAEKELEKLREARATVGKQHIDAEKELDAKQITAQSARAVVPDVSVVRAKLAEVEATNQKVRDNLKAKDAAGEVHRLDSGIADLTAAIERAEDEKQKMLMAAKFPVEGLGLSDAGVTFGGLPFAQASSSEQLRVSVAIGLALNPTLKVLLVRNGNLLDDDSMKAVAEQADAADAQLWCEYVTANPEGVSVFIEDGHVAEQAT